MHFKVWCFGSGIEGVSIDNNRSPKGALVAEICNLISANLRNLNLPLTCEVRYSKLLPEIPKSKEPEGKEEIITEKARVDLVVSKGSLD
jgi:hypothetical protein